MPTRQYNRHGVGYYLEFIIGVIFIVILYFLLKGVLLSSLRKSYKYLYIYISLIAVNAAYIILYWPTFNPKLTAIAWYSINFLGVLYSLGLIYFTQKIEDDINIKTSTCSNCLYLTKKGKIFFFTLSIICILVLIFSLIFQFILIFGLSTANYYYYPNPFVFIWFIGYASIIALIYFSIRFFCICKSKEIKFRLCICFCFFVIFLFIFLPFDYFSLPQIFWVFLDLLGIYVYSYFYILCMRNADDS